MQAIGLGALGFARAWTAEAAGATYGVSPT